MYPQIQDDAKDRLKKILTLRLPWLIIGLVGGIIATFLVSRYEEILVSNIKLAFFLPIIVYMSDAVGTQTQTIYVRSISDRKDKFFKYLVKEMLLGIFLGIIFGGAIFTFAYLWMENFETASTVGVAMLITISIAPIVALTLSEFIFKEHQDPALGAGPVTTIVQDILSILVYFLIATFIIFK